MKKIKRIFSSIRTNGILGFIIKFLKKLSYRIFAKLDRIDAKRTTKIREKIMKVKEDKYTELEKLCNNDKYKYIFVFYPYTEWNLPIFQRPQQIALQLSKREDVLYFFCTANCMYDNVDIYEKINDNLYITTEFEYLFNLKSKKRILHLYSTDIVSNLSLVKEALNKNDKVLYEYIDEIHEDITASVTPEFMEKHNYIMQNEECYIVATADKLYNDVKAKRKKNYVLSTNGVNIEDFILEKNSAIPEKLEQIKSNHEKIIGYYGALAKWFDYELLDKVAKKYPKYAIVLIGLDYDKSLNKSGLLNNKNVFYLGKVNYKELINYASRMDLLTIPFKINEITESTSPVKLFEYMAIQKPILTTDMRECRKYKSVNIGKTHEEFISKIPKVIKRETDENYKKLLMKEAKQNTWKEKSEVIIKLLEEGEKNK